MTTSRPDSAPEAPEDNSHLEGDFARAIGGSVRIMILIEPGNLPAEVPTAAFRLSARERDIGSQGGGTGHIVHQEHGCSVVAAPTSQWVSIVRFAARFEELEVVIVATGAPTGDRSPGVMVASDHLNFAGHNPLVGPNRGELGTRFPDMSDPYDAGLRRRLDSLGKSGIIASVPRPFVASDAEVSAALGASALTSGVAEAVIAAVHAGLPIAAVIRVDMAETATSQGGETVDRAAASRDASLWALVTDVADLVCSRSD